MADFILYIMSCTGWIPKVKQVWADVIASGFPLTATAAILKPEAYGSLSLLCPGYTAVLKHWPVVQCCSQNIARFSCFYSVLYQIRVYLMIRSEWNQCRRKSERFLHTAKTTQLFWQSLRPDWSCSADWLMCCTRVQHFVYHTVHAGCCKIYSISFDLQPVQLGQ